MNTSKKYHVSHNQQQYGPMTWNELLRYNFPPNALYWTEGMANWQPLSALMPQAAPPPPPLPGQPLNVNVSFEDERYGDFGTRLVAYLIDFAILFVIHYLVALIFGLVFKPLLYRNIEAYLAISYVLGLLIAWMYFAFFESGEHKATPGKMVMKIQVVDMQYNRISFPQATSRYFSKLLSGLIIGIGYLMVLWTPQRQGLHDQIAKTYVVKKDIAVQ